MKVTVVVASVCSLAAIVFAQKNNHFVSGRNTIVQLFEWKWEDIAKECEQFLGPKGYAGVQISPPNENQIINTSHGRSWSERYQGVSYHLHTRSGDEKQLTDMVRRCNQVGVRIYADVALNHMAGMIGNGTDGSTCDPETKDYPAVPYNTSDFHRTCQVTDIHNATNVRDCEIAPGLRDLDQGHSHVRIEIVRFLNSLIKLGIAGFRIDLAKFMWPIDLTILAIATNSLPPEHGFPWGARPFFYQEVNDLDGGAVKKTEYSIFGMVLEFKYGLELGKAFLGDNPLKNLSDWGNSKLGLLRSADAVAFIDNHDNQRDGTEGILTYKNPKPYKMANAFMLGHPYGTTKVMSSFEFQTYDQGPPSDSNGNIVGPEFNDDGTCTNGWVCEHRWRQIYNMVGFRNTVEGTSITHWWDNGDNQIAFGRGNKGFIAFTLSGNINESLPTSLPAGTYCDVISGDVKDGKCTGKVVVVDNTGHAAISLPEDEMDGVLAIHVDAKLDN